MAFQALFQLDARDGEDHAEIREGLEGYEPSDGRGEIKPKDRDTAMATALAAWADRIEADREILALAPTWPSRRQPAVDRAILRLASHEMRKPGAQPKAIINECVEIAKSHSTDKSPAFINAVLDKLYKSLAPQPIPADPEGAKDDA